MTTALALAFCMMTVVGYVEQGVSKPSSDEAAIRELVKRYVNAREKSDAAAIRGLFTEDADQLTSSGEWRKGREDLVRGTLSSSSNNPGARTITIEAIRFPAPDMALADGKYTIAGADGATRSMWTTFVLVKAAGAWRIAAIRNMLPAAARRA